MTAVGESRPGPLDISLGVEIRGGRAQGHTLYRRLVVGAVVPWVLSRGAFLCFLGTNFSGAFLPEASGHAVVVSVCVWEKPFRLCWGLVAPAVSYHRPNGRVLPLFTQTFRIPPPKFKKGGLKEVTAGRKQSPLSWLFGECTGALFGPPVVI